MELQNYERELKYLIMRKEGLLFDEILNIFRMYGYIMVEAKQKKKNEAYYDDANFSVIKRGDVIRGSTHFNKDGIYFHFMYKKNASKPNKPYLSKYELGSGQFDSVKDFISALNLYDCVVQEEPVLYAEMTRETAVFEKDGYKLLISFDNVSYYKEKKTEQIFEKMLEIEDWTTPYTLKAEKDDYDAHLLDINSLVLKDLPIKLTKESKPYRGLLLLGKLDSENSGKS